MKRLPRGALAEVQLKDLPIRRTGFAATVRFDTFQRVQAGVVNSPRQCCARRREERDQT